jgi:hypothetical protein
VSVDDPLLPERTVSQKIFFQVNNSLVQGLAWIARFESQFARGLTTIQIPEVLGHLNRTRFYGRSKIPLFEKGIYQLRACDRDF